MKKLLLFIAVIFSVMAAYGQSALPPLKSVTMKAPDIDKSNIILECPDRYYYILRVENPDNGLTEEQIHCYYPKALVDVTLDIHLFLGGVEDSWYDKTNDDVYIVTVLMAYENITMNIYKVTPRNFVLEEMEIYGMRPCALNNYNPSDQCEVKHNGHYVEIKDYSEGSVKHKYYGLDLKPYRMRAPKDIELTPLNIGFVQVNKDGVNIRQKPNPKSPRLGYFKRMKYDNEWDDVDPALEWENNPDGIKPFSPYHPEKGKKYFYNKNLPSSNGWHPLEYDKYISSNFVDEISNEPITLNRDFSADYFKDGIYLVKNGKYAGLCLYKWIDPFTDMGNRIYFGKIVDGIIQFYGNCFAPNMFDPDIKGIKYDKKYSCLSFGPDVTVPDSYDIDLSKLTTPDIDVMMSKADPCDSKSMFIVGFPGENIIIGD